MKAMTSVLFVILTLLINGFAANKAGNSSLRRGQIPFFHKIKYSKNNLE
jgi:hypothetical protein